MILWRKEYLRTEAEDQYRRLAVLREYNTSAGWSVVFKRHECEWILPYHTAVHLPHNPRHLPVVIARETSNEAYYLYLSIRRILLGYRAYRTPLPINQWYESKEP